MNFFPADQPPIDQNAVPKVYLKPVSRPRLVAGKPVPPNFLAVDNSVNEIYVGMGESRRLFAAVINNSDSDWTFWCAVRCTRGKQYVIHYRNGEKVSEHSPTR